ncbi:hypothetical protein E2P81_ATG02991 [Venturia nashicola]|uniref:Uncharacterized protein n=1 Tax=Venturia nashicola TaxID=86259 RepID=A0A4Z1PJ59_9PEZI|nr:hypothetical protein E6O75_ATG03056 [Venturia nashicola]TLD36102.1 hypothetical protein E2P81_ATG02991 [Venturia nashicola]
MAPKSSTLHSMPTRGLLGFRRKGIRKASQNNYDSYPEGLGKEIIEFILNLSDTDHDRMQEHLENLTWVDLNSKPDEASVERYTQLGLSDEETLRYGPAEDWYMLLHRMQGGRCLPAILKGDLLHLIDDSAFLEDTMFCEWAYYIDFEEEELEVWTDAKMLCCFGFEELATINLGAAVKEKQEEEKRTIKRKIAEVDSGEE